MTQPESSAKAISSTGSIRTGWGNEHWADLPPGDSGAPWAITTATSTGRTTWPTPWSNGSCPSGLAASDTTAPTSPTACKTGRTPSGATGNAMQTFWETGRTACIEEGEADLIVCFFWVVTEIRWAKRLEFCTNVFISFTCSKQ